MTAAEIAPLVNKKRETVCRFLVKLDKYADEMSNRRETARERRKAYKQAWEKLRRGGVSADDLRLDHERAVRELSSERYYN